MFLYEGKIGVGDTFNWVTRVRVVLDAAQGMLKTKCKDNYFS